MIIADFVAVRVESFDWPQRGWRDPANLPFGAVAIILIVSFSVWWLTARLDRKHRK
jgi:hypothetical protein